MAKYQLAKDLDGEMKRLAAIIGFSLLLQSPSYGWFDKGHMIVARLAWKELDEAQRGRIIAILKKHPHVDEFFTAKCPDGISEGEWLFMQAATWPDWVGQHHSNEYAHPKWHYINYPFVPPQSRLDASRLEPKIGDEHIIRALADSVKKIKTGSDAEKAIYLCWLIHLVGDAHQPLHCVDLFNEQFPDGDFGGNLAVVRLPHAMQPVKLHIFWDGLPGQKSTDPSLDDACREVASAMKEKADRIASSLESNQSFESWAKESFELAKTVAYLNGDLRIGKLQDNMNDVDAPEVPGDYETRARRTAMMQIGKAGARLAQQLKEQLAAIPQ